MAFCEFRYSSPSLGMQTAANIFVPQRSGPFAVLYLLHGLSDNHTIWQRRTRLEAYLDELNLPLMIVMPDGGRGFYTDAQEGFAYESAIVKDLVPLIDTTFQTSGKRAVGGLSMGGYGGVKLALKYPELFVSGHSHSGALAVARSLWERDDAFVREMTRIFGDSPAGGPDDPFALAKQASPRPALRIDCGVDDFLIEGNRVFSAYLNELGYDHEYEEFPGGHSWEYWDLHIRQALQFHARHLFA
ncbi:MAG TPA: alpha/beta hydrolase family protein [Abditibacteriaceae bacterium]|jgi:S-formylglutathione hydrolase FrmB